MGKSISMAKLAKVFQNPDSLLLSKSELCELAGISSGVYTKIMRDPEFKKVLDDLKFRSLSRGKGAIIQSMMLKAIEGDVNAAKLVLQLSGDLVQEKGKVTIENNVTNIKLSDIEKRKIDGLIRRREDICS